MFIQAIVGQVTSADEARAANESWQRDIAPGAVGFLGSTGGVTADGTLVEIVRFESAEAARTNSDRPEQGEWWTATSKMFTGEPKFFDCGDVVAPLSGGSDTAGFVQVMVMKIDDVEAFKELGERMMEALPAMRPDFLGATDGYTDDGICVTTNYFTSEADARKGEKQEMPPEGAELFQQFQKMTSDIQYYDLTDPWFFTP